MLFTAFLPLGFASCIVDRHTGLIRFGYRDYDPEIGRFTALDPAKDMRGDGDLWDYCVDDPINAVDPWGLEAEKDTGGAETTSGKEATPSASNESENIPVAPLGNSIEDHMKYADAVAAEIDSKSNNPISADIRKAFWIRNNLGNKGLVDFKQEGHKYEDAGNYYFGAYAARMGVPEELALVGAGWAQRQAGTSRQEWGTPYDLLFPGNSSYGDDPKDQEQIRNGFHHAKRWKK